MTAVASTLAGERRSQTTEMPHPGVAAFEAFITDLRSLYREGRNVPALWRGVVSRLEALARDEAFRKLTDGWPEGDGKQYVVHVDAEYGFAIDALVRGPFHKAPAHDHAHTWTAYGVIAGWERVTRYVRTDDGSDPKHAVLKEVSSDICHAGGVDLVPPWSIHTESNDDNRAVALVVRSENLGGFDQTAYRDSGEVMKMRGLERIEFPIHRTGA